MADSIGIKLLRKMGWRHGQGIGPRIKKKFIDEAEGVEDEHASEYLFPPQDITTVILSGTSGVHGIGYRPFANQKDVDDDETAAPAFSASKSKNL